VVEGGSRYLFGMLASEAAWETHFPYKVDAAWSSKVWNFRKSAHTARLWLSAGLLACFSADTLLPLH
jgi:hypothetical protein